MLLDHLRRLLLLVPRPTSGGSGQPGGGPGGGARITPLGVGQLALGMVGASHCMVGSWDEWSLALQSASTSAHTSVRPLTLVLLTESGIRCLNV